MNALKTESDGGMIACRYPYMHAHMRAKISQRWHQTSKDPPPAGAGGCQYDGGAPEKICWLALGPEKIDPVSAGWELLERRFDCFDAHRAMIGRKYHNFVWVSSLSYG